MSLATYDRTLDPPDPLLCEEHGEAQPCRQCRIEAAEFRYECERKGELFRDR